jgi:hypothetical protein
LVAVAFLTLVIGGCKSTSPYDYGTNWLIRENDIPQYFSKFDLFYIGKAPSGYGDTHDIQFNWTKTHTSDIFGNGVRVFAPEISDLNVDNIAKALEYYLTNFHQPGHPFILLGEGEEADLLYAAMRKVDGLTVKNGFIAAYLPDMKGKTVKEIADDFYWDDLTAAKGEDDLGVIITWRSRINNEVFEDEDKLQNVYNINPLNWKLDNTVGTKKDNIKAVFYMPEHKNLFWRKVDVENFCGAVLDLEKGVLEIECPLPILHVSDGKFTKNCISIFAGNIAANAKLRVEKLKKNREWKK